MDLATALAPEPGVKWIIGRVTAVTGETLTMTYRGGTVTNVGVMDQYTPKVGDVVHVLSSDVNGMIAIGSNNQAGVPVVAPTPRTAVTVASTSTATYTFSTNTWQAGSLVESPDQIGCWFYPFMTLTPSLGIQPLASLSIQVTAQGAAPLEFVLHTSAGPTGVPAVIASYRVAAPLLPMPTDMRLPLGWATLLLSGQALGVGIGGGDYTAIFTGSSGLLTFTPLT
jgi:hypothetical protein